MNVSCGWYFSWHLVHLLVDEVFLALANVIEVLSQLLLYLWIGNFQHQLLYFVLVKRKSHYIAGFNVLLHAVYHKLHY